jgi:hypothetical protein
MAKRVEVFTKKPRHLGFFFIFFLKLTYDTLPIASSPSCDGKLREGHFGLKPILHKNTFKTL